MSVMGNENIIENVDKLGGKVANAIKENEESGRLCKHLAMIKTDIELPFSLDETLYSGYHVNELSDFCRKYDLKTLLNKMDQKFVKENKQTKEIEYKIVKSLPSIDDKKIGIALDFDEDDYYDGIVNGIAITSNHQTYYLNIKDAKKDNNLLEILKSNTYEKYCYDFKAIKVALSRTGIEINGLTFDLLIAAYIIDTSLINNIDAIFNFFSIYNK